MEHHTTIEINNLTKQITLKPALYMDLPVWEVTIDGKYHIIRKNGDGWSQSSDSTLDPEVLHKIGHAIEYLRIKDAS